MGLYMSLSGSRSEGTGIYTAHTSEAEPFILLLRKIAYPSHHAACKGKAVFLSLFSNYSFARLSPFPFTRHPFIASPARGDFWLT